MNQAGVMCSGVLTRLFGKTNAQANNCPDHKAQRTREEDSKKRTLRGVGRQKDRAGKPCQERPNRAPATAAAIFEPILAECFMSLSIPIEAVPLTAPSK